MTRLSLAISAMALSMTTTAVYAESCAEVDVESTFDLDEAQVVALYDCLKDKMAAGYAKEGDAVGSNYRNWTVTSTRPAVAGPHGERLLQTFANDIAAEQYLKFAEEGVQMPVGSVLAKESVSFSKKKKTARPGPLFIMTKLDAGGAPETDDWLYGGLQPNGKPMKFKQAFCHDCHAAWEDQDSLAYPLEEVRISN
ncbi:cytochrome P460 family protein [Roseobacter sp. YSTF-M11]|uniref:Cytochrome P460 family protein n=1 Tax=Roseobacter insulae TaxID=2859783 RepID=A0A9X1FUG6_9RHOB|nr:cytochrome P460 family protein [Roseobacter insulae]MBW4707614.1 cytochrome P460 family protein [Roseobacter insulae]